MRHPLRRALALATTAPFAAGALLLATPAAHASHDAAPDCGAGSTVLVDFTLAGGFPTRIAAYDVSPTVRNVCVEVLGEVQTVLVLRSGVALTEPSVVRTDGAGSCATPIIDMTAPVELSLSAGVSTAGPAICAGHNGTTTTLTFTGASVQALPAIEVWTLHNTWLNIVSCPAHDYVLDAAGLSSGEAYWTCQDRDNRLL